MLSYNRIRVLCAVKILCIFMFTTFFTSYFLCYIFMDPWKVCIYECIYIHTHTHTHTHTHIQTRVGVCVYFLLTKSVSIVVNHKFFVS
jgi:hypothetical protein